MRTRLITAAASLALVLVGAGLAHAQEPTPTPTAPAIPTPSPSPSPTPAAPTPAEPTPSPSPTQSPTPAPAPAAPAPTPAPVPPWKGSFETGATVTSGNTEVQTVTGALKLDGAWRGWGVAVRGAGVYSETESIQTAGSWDASVRGDRTIAGVLGSYVRLSIDGDRFKGFENRKGAGLGFSVARKWAANDPLPAAGPGPAEPPKGYDRAAMRAELGYQFVREDLVGVDEDHDIHGGRVSLGLAYAPSRDTTFSNETEALYDFETEGRYLVTNVAAAALAVRTNLALKLSVTVKVDTEPPLVDPANPGSARFEEVDTLTTIALLLSF